MKDFTFYNLLKNPIIIYNLDFSSVHFRNETYINLFNIDWSDKFAAILKKSVSEAIQESHWEVDAFTIDKVEEGNVSYYRCTYDNDFNDLFPILSNFKVKENLNEKYGFWYLLTNEKLIFWSKNILDNFGIKNTSKRPEYLTIEDYLKYVHPDDAPKLEKAISGLLEQSEHIDNLEYRLVLDNNITKHIRSASFLMDKQDGKVLQVFGITEDVTLERTTESDHANSIFDLNKSNTALTEFAYNASHDLQEPLRKIEAYSNRLMKSLANKADEKTLKYFDKLILSTQRMSDLIEDILSLSRLNTMPTVKDIVDLNEVLIDVINDYEISIIESNAKIIVDLPKVLGIKTQLHQLFQNLIGNSIKFRAENRSPKITLSHILATNEAKIKHNLNPKLDYYCIKVEDNGIGFERKFSDMIFEPFKRLFGRSEFKGTGIGLAICKKVVENHNGFIVAESEEDKGSIFYIYLPLIK